MLQTRPSSKGAHSGDAKCVWDLRMDMGNSPLVGSEVVDQRKPQPKQLHGCNKLLGTLAHLTTAKLEALNALLVPLRAHTSRARDGSHDGS